MSDDGFTLDDKKLKNLIKAFKGKMPLARVGIRGGGERNEGEKSNAEIGAYHEYGTTVTPQRSFLRVPINDNMEKYMESAGAFKEQSLKKVIKEKSINTWVTKMAELGYQIVMEAFDTGGFGKWKPSNMDGKKNKQTLVETQQLRNSITTEVK